MQCCSLKIKSTALLFLLVSTVILVVVMLGLLFFIREFKTSSASRQFSFVSAMAGELDDKIIAAQRELVAVAASLPPELIHDRASLQRFLAGRLDARQVFGDTFILSERGELLANSHGNEHIGQNYSFRQYFKRTVATGKPVISEPFQSSRGDGHSIVVFTAPIYDGRGRLIGLLGGRVDLMQENLLGRLARLNLGKAGNFFLFSKSREMMVLRDQSVGDSWLAPGGIPLIDRVVGGYQGSGEARFPRGGKALCSFKRLDSTGWILAGKLPVSEAYAEISRAEHLVLYSLGLALPLALLAVWFFVGKLTAPILTLAKCVGEMGPGMESLPIPVCSTDEIGILARSFNEVMQELGKQRRLLEAEKGLSEQLLQHTAVPSFVIDSEHRLLIWNAACEELTGVAAGELIGGSDPWRGFYEAPRQVLADVVVDGALHEMEQLYSCYADSPLIPEGLRAEGWLRLKGKQRYLSFDAAPIRDAEGGLVAAIQTLQDVTLRVTNEEQLRSMVAAIGESEERFRRLVELSLDGIAILVQRRFVFVNQAGCEMLGFTVPEELNGREISEFFQRDSLELFEEQLCYAAGSGSTAPWIEGRLLRNDRTALDVELGAGPFVYSGDAALQVIFRDITERKLAKARLETLAHYDSLTSLPNRVLFFDRLQHAVTEAKRHQHALALMFLDLDRYKEINDSLGHAAGDAVLVEAGRRLKECVRACDMVARMGGDEFTIILSKMADDRDAAIVAERIIHSLSLPFMIEGERASIGVSIGICVYPRNGAELDAIVRQADLALYRAKQDGRNGYRFYGG
jgi:diguanylate cyclase (GGDEF)-like protein/PAS domain S-box-containing protein